MSDIAIDWTFDMEPGQDYFNSILAEANAAIEKALVVLDVPVPRAAPRSYMAAVIHQAYAKLQLDAHLADMLSTYGMPDLRRPAKKPRPKWGQPGRGRKRKARLLARSVEREKQRLFAKVRGLADGAIVIGGANEQKG